MSSIGNPFEITKAVDYTDEEIDRTWVNLPGSRPADWPISGSVMPIFLVGAKGGGRTHLLRHISFPLQRYRSNREDSSALDQVRRGGYIGVYLRCGGLNSSRFTGKGVSSEQWAGVFAYYTDVWLASLCLDTLCEMFPRVHGKAFAEQARQLFDPPLDPAPISTSELRDSLKSELRTMDIAINNVALTGQLPLTVRTNPGKLVFGIPSLIESHVSELAGMIFYYLVDEFENLTEDQQVYLNTLVREREGCSTFIVGSRRFGIRTRRTLSGGEENRPGSEFDEIILEDDFRSDPTGYTRFCISLVETRLTEAGYPVPRDLRTLFVEHEASDRLWSEKVLGLLEGRRGGERPWLRDLASKVRRASLPEDETASVVAALRFDDAPLLEKFAMLHFFRDWQRMGGPSIDAAYRCRSLAESVRSERDRRAVLSFDHYREDLYAQARYSLQRGGDYFGLDNLVRMSGYVPRNFLLTLKKIYKWASFEGLPATEAGPLSISAQQQGVFEASEWFLSDSKALGKSGEDAQMAVRRLGSFLRGLRFTDKPVEVSVATVAFNRRLLSDSARATLDTCVRHGQLIELPMGHRTKNRETLLFKYQLNPMLAPLFDLPISRRGVLQLTDMEASVLLDPSTEDSALRAIQAARLRLMNAPFGRPGLAQLW